MTSIMVFFTSLWIKLFFVLTPFFGLTMFVTLTEGYDQQHRKRLALSVASAAAVICLILFFVGPQVFALFGITLDSFRVGAGTLLLLSGISLCQGRAGAGGGVTGGDIAVVPLAIPIIVGPATTGTLLVMGAELSTLRGKLIGSLALLAAVGCVGAVLVSATALQRILGLRGIAILSRLTGLIVAALAAQMIMTGVRSFLGI
ncbi:MAG: MarC family protein [Lentisphaerae bacterium]|nr:MarC family protein [Lentisphaerota bacterium]